MFPGKLNQCYWKGGPRTSIRCSCGNIPLVRNSEEMSQFKIGHNSPKPDGLTVVRSVKWI
jgi:hypothetical protein